MPQPSLRALTCFVLVLCPLLLLAARPPAAAQHDDMVEVPLRIRAGHLVVPVTAPDGSELEFGLGTGSPPTVLSTSTAEHFGLDAALSLGGIAIATEGRETRTDLTGADGRPLAGLVGASALSRYDVLVDAPGGRLLLRDAGPQAPWPGVELGAPTPVRIFHGSVISFDALVNGTQFFSLLDLGTSPNVLSPGVTGKLGLPASGEASVTIGSVELTALAYRGLDLPMFRRFDPEENGIVILGAPVALDCAIELSWARGEIRTCVR